MLKEMNCIYPAHVERKLNLGVVRKRFYFMEYEELSVTTDAARYGLELRISKARK